MSDDSSRTVGPARPYEAFTVGEPGVYRRRFDNPLVKGLLVLLMTAVAATILVVTDDVDPGTVVAGATLASEPLAPDVSVQEVSGAAPGGPAAGPTVDTPPAKATPELMADPAPADDAAERARLLALATPTSTTEAPTTTAAPTTTTAAPTTEAPNTTTTAAPATESAPAESATDDTAASSSDTDTPSTETTVPAEGSDGATETTVAADETTTAPPTTAAPTTAAPEGQEGWVDTGNGVLVPQVLLDIRWCESRDNYQAANPSSSARGAYQFLTGSWRGYGHAERYGVGQAHLASKAQQDEAALLTWERDGTRPWNASRHCWSSR